MLFGLNSKTANPLANLNNIKTKIDSGEVDFNEWTQSNIYYLNGSKFTLVHAPDSILLTNCYVLVFQTGKNRVAQIIFPGNDEHIYYRSTVVDSTQWFPWKKL